MDTTILLAVTEVDENMEGGMMVMSVMVVPQLMSSMHSECFELFMILLKDTMLCFYTTSDIGDGAVVCSCSIMCWDGILILEFCVRVLREERLTLERCENAESGKVSL